MNKHLQSLVAFINDELSVVDAKDQPRLLCETYLQGFETSQQKDYIPYELQIINKHCLKDNFTHVRKFYKTSGNLEALLLLCFDNRAPAISANLIKEKDISYLISDYPITFTSLLFRERRFDFLYQILSLIGDGIISDLPQAAHQYLAMTLFFMHRATQVSVTTKTRNFSTDLGSLESLSPNEITLKVFRALRAAFANQITDALHATIDVGQYAKENKQFVAAPLNPMMIFADHCFEGLSTPASVNWAKAKLIGSNCVVTACDRSYFNRYFDKFCEKSSFDAATLHLHCIDFTLSDTEISEYEQKYDILLSVSDEKFEFKKYGDIFGSWCAASRYWVLDKLSNSFDKIAVVDIDGYILENFPSLIENAASGFHIHGPDSADQGNPRFPWNYIYAGNVLIVIDDATKTTVSEISCAMFNGLKALANNESKTHYFDQICLIKHLIGSSLSIHQIPMFFHQNEALGTAFNKRRPTQ